MLGLIMSAATRWMKKYRTIAKTSPFYVFGFGTEDKVVTSYEELTVPQDSTAQVIYNYKSLTINEGATLTIANKPEASDNIITPSVNPIIIMCSKSLTVNGHLNVDGASTFTPAADAHPDTSMFLGQKFIQGVTYNDGPFNSISEQTYALIKAYAANNIMTNMEVVHAGRGSYKTSGGVMYPAKGGMIVLYYNRLNNDGSIHANGATVPVTGEDPSAIKPCYGGGTLIICAPTINVGAQGKITADGGRSIYGYGAGAVGALNTVPEQVSDQQQSPMFLGYIGSVYDCVANAERLVSYNVSVSIIGNNTITLPITTDVITTYKIFPSSTGSSTTPAVGLSAPSGATTGKCYIFNASSSTTLAVRNPAGSLFNPTLCTVSPGAAVVIYYNNSSWSYAADNTYVITTGGVSGNSKAISFTLPTRASTTATTQLIYEAEMKFDIPENNLTFLGSAAAQWISRILVLSNINFNTMTGSLKPSIYCEVYKKDVSNELTLINTSPRVEITTKSADLVYYTLTNPLATDLVLVPGESLVYKYYLYYPERFKINSNSSNKSISFYIGYNETASSEAMTSTVLCPPSNASARGGAGLCIGIKLPEVV